MVSDHVAGDSTNDPADEGRPAQPDLTALKGAAPDHILSALKYVERLSNREIAVFELLGNGYSNRDISQHLKLSERTVKRHVSALLNKLDVESRLQAGLAAQLTRLLRSGLL
ncbi:MAG TPA: helix-turn-helix transcriptional regulator [Streptosporangiaceae bacterium]|nr:helix-turn-helix transcriptional regulator [Streptosporangiaceae bacterium]